MNHEASMQDMCKDMNSVSCHFVFTFPKFRRSETSKYAEESIKYIKAMVSMYDKSNGII